MNLLIALTFAICCCAIAAQAEDTTTTVTTNVATSAQDDADEMARTGIMRHRGNNCGCLEGVATAGTRQRAIERCCFWNTGHTIIEIGVAQGRCGRWFACVRYVTELRLNYFRPRRAR